MAAPVPPGAPRPGNNQPPPPPNYNPNIRGTPDSLANNMQSLNLNRPPMASNSVARPGAPPFGQAPPFQSSAPSQGFPSGAPPFSRPGAPPGAQARPAGPPSGPPSSAFPQNVASVRPSGPPISQPPFGSRPPPTSLTSSMGAPAPPVSGVPHPGGSPPIRLVSPAPPPSMSALVQILLLPHLWVLLQSFPLQVYLVI
ncbi:hypothetical protein L6164_001287 [Bauhinia variegata]|uniref:Uncharacterized protein n=1 Tax=Bauhinia variegata TaxID=167791 RepID=A0ACB9QBU9_BAUVA|nr:hypothetical protein L6164_001287 [Bauhinia variegata]